MSLFVEGQYAKQVLFGILIGAPEGRSKAWGTGYAKLSCYGLIDTPFAVINANDYYGKMHF